MTTATTKQAPAKSTHRVGMTVYVGTLYREWVNDFIAHERLTLPTLIDQAFASIAATRGYPAPPALGASKPAASD